MMSPTQSNRSLFASRSGQYGSATLAASGSISLPTALGSKNVVQQSIQGQGRRAFFVEDPREPRPVLLGMGRQNPAQANAVTVSDNDANSPVASASLKNIPDW
jgi:hypothetical protein